MNTTKDTIRQLITNDVTLLNNQDRMRALFSDAFPRSNVSTILCDMCRQGICKSIYDIRRNEDFSEQVQQMRKAYMSPYKREYVTQAFVFWATVAVPEYEQELDDDIDYDADNNIDNESIGVIIGIGRNILHTTPLQPTKPTTQIMIANERRAADEQRRKNLQQLCEKSETLFNAHVILFIIFALIAILLLCITHSTHFFLTLLLCVVAGFIFAVLLQDIW